MKKFLTRKRAIALGLVASLAVAAAAFAFLSVTGTGSGSGSVTASASNVTLTVTALPDLTKIGDTQTAEITASNTGTSPQKISSLTVTAAPSTAAATAGCPAGSFTVGTVTTTGNEIPAATDAETPGTAVVGHAPITFADVNSAQNGCIGTDTVALTLGHS